jgi:hypothetical protein
MSARRTSWFSGRKRVPGHIGVWERRHPFNRSGAPIPPIYSHWDGKVWGAYAPTPDGAVKFAGQPSEWQDLEFRGFTTDQSPTSSPRS